MTTPAQADQKLLLKAADDIVYEMMMLLNTRYIYEDSQKRLTNAANLHDKTYWHCAQNGMLESFLLHYRNLKQFLNNEKYATDIKAVHYAPGWKPDTRLHIADEDQRINRKLAHLAYDRVELPRGWNMEEMERRVCSVFKDFLDKSDYQYSPLFADCRSNLTSHGY